ncbi:maleylpyruvate isomerase N-terminal domain-containing protein [Streptomyces platensis]|uniref:maleylpyruvate isomerase N-terminal domain-containing protein n=1 Tax=Streptomyces platensis TaxID=58346 RepID=UPI002251DF4E|nr:maleylpyruvate isomerase N-terminal domain-containing protein [Streptomyces platensis]MCX4638586.1 maleylpyruvate isomerase N-terminal domain-containing protein [Streptomyces platensis]WSI54002.1 maleylpyruvate isomerase N-terminal domain-containing protein [Streptomyces platensis]WTI56074.1 maleylpyruvate isomerase N-terminal domain-containing protein [Streptomyces platensis]
MRHFALIDAIERQSEELRTVLLDTGPGVPVATCPGWTSNDILGHMAWAYGAAMTGMDSPPDGPMPDFGQSPKDWGEALGAWDVARGKLLERLNGIDPAATRAWVFSPAAEKTAVFWLRVVAHETAIHRLDTEHARAGGESREMLESITFDAELAMDGIEEYLTLLVPAFVPRRDPITIEGDVTYRATDTDRVWHVRVRPGAVPQVVDTAGTHERSASVTGSADAVYRELWGRPSNAVVTGDHELIETLRSP